MHLDRFLQLCTQAERFGGKPINQNRSYNRIQDTEHDTGDAEHQNRHFKIHHTVAYKVCDDHHQAVCPAFHLCSGVIGLQQIINREVMDREKQAHAENRYK